jgi:hypothetical protein
MLVHISTIYQQLSANLLLVQTAGASNDIIVVFHSFRCSIGGRVAKRYHARMKSITGSISGCLMFYMIKSCSLYLLIKGSAKQILGMLDVIHSASAARPRLAAPRFKWSWLNDVERLSSTILELQMPRCNTLVSWEEFSAKCLWRKKNSRYERLFFYDFSVYNSGAFMGLA